MNKLNYEILSAIDNIETTVMESEINVMNSLMDSYSKSIMILENCDDNTDVDAFDIFQESVIMEADDNNGNKKKKSIKEKILDFIEIISRMIKKAWNFLKRKLDRIRKNNKPIVDEKLVEEIKDIVDDNDTVSVEITEPTNGSGKPEVTVSTASHDTQKEEKIKSKVESVVSSIKIHSYGKSSGPAISFGNGNSGTTALSNVSPFKSGIAGNSGTAALSDISTSKVKSSSNKSSAPKSISFEVSKVGIKLKYIDRSKNIEALSIYCKKFVEFFGYIDIDKISENDFYEENYRKKIKELRQYEDAYVYHPNGVKKEANNLNELKQYKESTISILNECLDTIKKYSDNLEKTINEYKKKNNVDITGIGNELEKNKGFINAYMFFRKMRANVELIIENIDEEMDDVLWWTSDRLK